MRSLLLSVTGIAWIAAGCSNGPTLTFPGGALTGDPKPVPADWSSPGANADVRLRIEGSLYDLRGERVEDAETIAVFAKARTAQSIFRRDPTRLERVWI